MCLPQQPILKNSNTCPILTNQRRHLKLTLRPLGLRAAAAAGVTMATTAAAAVVTMATTAAAVNTMATTAAAAVVTIRVAY